MDIFWTKRFNLLYLFVKGYLPSENTLTSRGGCAGKDRRVEPILAARSAAKGRAWGVSPQKTGAKRRFLKFPTETFFLVFELSHVEKNSHAISH